MSIFYEQAKQEPLWTQHQIKQYIEYQKERIDKGEIKESTINNYYQSVKLFCEMNDIILNWKKIAKGKPQDDESTKEDDDNDVENIRVTLRLKKNFAYVLRLLAKYYDNGDIDKFTSEEVSKIICALAESSSSTILGPSISDELEQHIQSLLKDEQKKT